MAGEQNNMSTHIKERLLFLNLMNCLKVLNLLTLEEDLHFKNIVNIW